MRARRAHVLVRVLAQPRPPSRRGPGIQGRAIRVRGNPAVSSREGTRGRTSPGRHRAEPDQRTVILRTGGHRERRRPPATSLPRSGRPPGQDPCRPAPARVAARASTRRNSRGMASTGLAGQVPDRGRGQGRVPTARGNRGRGSSRDTRKEAPDRGRPDTVKASSRPGSQDQALTGLVSTGPAKDGDRLARNRTARRPVSPTSTRTVPPDRTGQDSTGVRRRPGSSAAVRGTPDRGRPPDRSRDPAGHLVVRGHPARTPGLGRPGARRRDRTGPRTRHRTVPVPTRSAAGRRRDRDSAVTRGTRDPGGPQGQSRTKAGRLDRAAGGAAAATLARGRPPDRSRDPAGCPVKNSLVQVSLAERSSVRA
jgi:hypothetical protein